MPKAVISPHAPGAIGTYSQALRCGDTFTGPDRPRSGEHAPVEGIDAQIKRVFDNLRAVAAAAGGSLADAVKLTIYLTDLAHFAKVNETMAAYFEQPYPARAAVGVASLPRGALIEADAILVTG
jgi:reactive intermediate/imine deaminase